MTSSIDINNNQIIPVIIPAFEPDERLIDLVRDLIDKGINNIIVVNDGSGEEYNIIFQQVSELLLEVDGTLLVHEKNQGKGKALKTAFAYVIEEIPSALGVVTADSDGQHTPDCILKIMDAINKKPQAFVLGVRDFSDVNTIPWKSRFGNNLTVKIFKIVSGKLIKDTQTGLRGISIDFLPKLLDLAGDRFEYETRMLLLGVKECEVVQIYIETIYDSKENHQTHFRPVADSVKIYCIFLEVFIKYLISSLSSFLIDIILFSIICSLLRKNGGYTYTIIATIIARVISAIYNYCINYHFVFKSEENKKKSAIKYFALAVSQMVLSALFVTIINYLMINSNLLINESIIKMLVDTVLFIVNYKIQKHFVF